MGDSLAWLEQASVQFLYNTTSDLKHKNRLRQNPGVQIPCIRRCEPEHDHVRFNPVLREAFTSMSRRETESDHGLV
ncbi:MAG: hypothetical protein ACREQV_05090, partial [Candidatus Binatia bacterium]